MTIRANSLRSVLVDGGFFLMAMALVALASSVANSQVSATDLRPDPKTTDDSIDSRQNTDDNPPSGDPTESAAAEAETLVLGMKLEEDSRGRAMVVDVGAASPAWDAGIRRGDQIRELHGLKPKNFAKWSHDLRKLLRDTQDGQAVPVEIARGDEQLSLRVKLPVARVDAVREANQQEQEQEKLAREQRQGQQMPPQGQGQDRIAEYGSDPYGRQAQPYGPGWGGGGVGVVTDGGTGVGTEQRRAATNAVAELHATNTLGGNATGAGGGRVGMAVFQNSQQGVSAHVEVNGLPQGSYRVGIGDGGSGSGFVNPFDNSQAGGAAGNDGRVRDDQRNQRDQSPEQNPEQLTPQQRQQLGIPLGPQNQQNNQQNNVPGNAPGGTGAPAPSGTVPGGATPTGGAAPGQSSSLAAPGGAAYLAQVVDAGSPQAAQAQTPPSQQPNATAQGAVHGNANAAAAGRDVGSSSNPRPDASQRRGLGGATNFPPGGIGGNMPNFVMELGMLQIGADGFGQVQTQLDGVNVQSLAGMRVAVVPATSQATGAGFGSESGANAQNFNQANQSNQGGRRVNGSRQSNVVPPVGNVQGNDQGGFGPVAMGVIRIVEGRGLPQQQPTDADGVTRQRGEAAATEQREQLQGRDLTTPPDQTFDPNQPRNQ